MNFKGKEMAGIGRTPDCEYAMESVRLYFPQLYSRVEDIYKNEISEYVLIRKDGGRVVFIDAPVLKYYEFDYTDSNELDSEMYRKEFGRRLKNIILYHLYSSYEQVAEESGVSLMTIYRLIHGETGITLDTLRTLSTAIKCPVENLCVWKY